jgi:hypothetical protein
MLRILLFLTLALSVGICVNATHARWQVGRKMEELRAKGLPVTPQDLEALYPQPSKDQNAAEVYAAFFKILLKKGNEPDYKGISERVESIKEGERPDPSLLAEMEAYLSANAEMLRLLHEAAALSGVRFPLDFSKGYEMETPYIWELHQSARLLRWETVVAGEKGNSQTAMNALTAAMNVCDCVREAPNWRYQATCMRMRGIVCCALDGVLCTQVFSDDQLAHLSESLARQEDSKSPVLAFSGDFATGLSFIGSRKSPSTAFSLAERIAPAVDKVFGSMLDRTGVVDKRRFHTMVVPALDTGLVHLFHWVGISDREELRFLTAMDAVVQAGMQPTQKAIPAEREIGLRLERVHSWIPSLTEDLVPTTSRYVELFSVGLARIRTAVTTVAVARYRLAHGTLPERLDELVPAFLSSVPLDPFDGKPLRYIHEGAGYTVYSIGHNMRDDQGQPLTRNGEVWEGDVTCRVVLSPQGGQQQQHG